LEDGRSIQLEAWVRFSGELRLYDSQEAADLDLIYPYCISGSFPDYALNRNPRWHDKRVRVTGTVLLPDEPSRDPNTIQTMQVADGILFANGCWGRYVLKIEKIEELDVPEPR
jgi:hypothetical protein